MGGGGLNVVDLRRAGRPGFPPIPGENRVWQGFLTKNEGKKGCWGGQKNAKKKCPKKGKKGIFYQKKAKILLNFACLFFRWGAKDALRGPQQARGFPYQNPPHFDRKIEFFWASIEFRWVNELRFCLLGPFLRVFSP